MTAATTDRSAGSPDVVAAVRAFNRFYTAAIELLTDGLVGSPYTLTEARVLYELAHGNDVEVSALRAELHLDAGYLSRILSRFTADGLVARDRSPVDGRRQVARLTPAGQATFATLDAASNEQLRALLGPLGEPDRAALLAALGQARGLLAGALATRGSTGRSTGARPVRLRAPLPGDLGWVVARHGRLYAEEHGWDSSFEALVAHIVADFATGHDPAREAMWVAEVDGEPAGCVFCVRKAARTAQLRLLLVEPWARGLRIGSQLVDRCLDFAVAAGYDEMVLWTNDVLGSARHIYQRAGFALVDEGPHHSFGHDLVEQTWRRALR